MAKSKSNHLTSVNNSSDSINDNDNRLDTAKRVANRKKLSEADINRIYFSLTGEELPNKVPMKRGPKSKLYERDIDLAFDFIDVKVVDSKKTAEAMKELGIKYNLPGGDAVIKETFYKAFYNGLRLIEKSSNEWIQAVESGCVPDYSPKTIKKWTLLAESRLELIKKYRKLAD